MMKINRKNVNSELQTSLQKKHINSEQAIDMYSNLSRAKGIEVYIWKDNCLNEISFKKLKRAYTFPSALYQ